MIVLVRQMRGQRKLYSYVGDEVFVPAPLRLPHRGDGDDGSWLGDEAYQTYSIRVSVRPFSGRG
jgi:hypothetical protein